MTQTDLGCIRALWLQSRLEVGGREAAGSPGESRWQLGLGTEW